MDNISCLKDPRDFSMKIEIDSSVEVYIGPSKDFSIGHRGKKAD